MNYQFFLSLIGLSLATTLYAGGQNRQIMYLQDNFPYVAESDDEEETAAKQTKTTPSFFYYKFPENTKTVMGGINYLYWTLSEPALHYATVKTNPIPTETPIGTGFGAQTSQLGIIEQASFDWSSGARIFIGTHFKDTPWSLYSEYTIYQTSGTNQLQRPLSSYGYLTGMDMLQDTATPAQSSTSKTSFKYESFRLLVETGFNPLPPVMVVLGFGPKLSSYHQLWTVLFSPFTNNLGNIVASSGTSTYNQMSWKAWGVGLNVAGDVEFHFGKGFALGVGGSISPLVGQVKNRSYNTDSPIGSTANVPNPIELDISQKYTYRLMWESQLSPTFSWSFNTSSAAFRFTAGYEFNCFWNMNEIYRAGPTQGTVSTAKYPIYSNEPIYAHGLVGGLAIAF